MIADMLKPYQRVAAERIADCKRMLLADQPGLGKTFTSLGALELSGVLTAGAVALVVAPLITCDTAWGPTIRKYMPEVNFIDGFSGSRKQRDKRISVSVRDDVPNVIVTNHDSIGVTPKDVPHLPSLHALRPVAILIDESHAVLPMQYDRPWDATQFWRGLYALNGESAGVLRLAISGTPDRGKLYYRFGTWRFLLPKQLGPKVTQYQDWLERTFFTWRVPMRLRNRTVNVLKVGHLRSPDNWKNLDRVLMIRRTKREVAQDLPDKQYVDVDVPFSVPLLQAYEDFVDEFVKTDDDSDSNALVFALRATQFAVCEWTSVDGVVTPVLGGESLKRDWLIDWLRSRNLHADADDAPMGKVVVSSQFTRVLVWLQREFERVGVKSEILSGNVSQAERLRVQREFQDADSSLRVVLLSARMGVGIDLDAADDLVFVDIPVNPDVQEQVEDRVHRVSRVHQVTIWRLRSRGTIDMTVSARNDEIYQQTRHLLDGVRNVSFERKVLERLGV